MAENKIERSFFIALQNAIFTEVAKKIGAKLPSNMLEISAPNSLIVSDFKTLNDRGLLRWDASVKFTSLCDLIEEHPIKLCIYYKKKPVGYATGCYNKNTGAVEISWLEKRNDADSDLDGIFFSIVLDAFSAYATSLSIHRILPEMIAVVSPIHECIDHYARSGMVHVSDYYMGSPAMVLRRLVNI